MPIILKLTLDYTFKKMFSENIDILIDLVNSVLEFPELAKVKCKNPQILAEDIHKKYIILDIMAYDDFDRQYNNEWLYFLKNAHNEKEENMQTSYTNPVIHKAFKTLKRLSEDEETRMLAEAKEMAIFNKKIELGYARKAGLEEGMLKGAHRMIVEVLNENFGNVPDGVKTRIYSIDNQSTLKALLFESFKSKDLKSFEKHL
ncbi:hypothetical protein MHK_002859 [Candidatus Magnetomorum sp. HK-1]|nr:hypothetical protein MHK_002859 [Candidatus Magnetomorum sp. HK-1]